ncbi:MAG: hypothetical protein ACYS3S_24110 [Planctomycetota bacterium]
MLAKNSNSRFHTIISLAVLLTFLAVARGQSLAEGSNNGSRQPKPSQKRLTPYEILRRSKFQPAAEQAPADFSTGPVIATAMLKIVPIKRGSPTHYLGMQRQDTRLVRPPELREQPADAPKEPVYFVVRVGDRNIHGITYRSIGPNRLVKLCLDTDGDGLFSDEKEYVGVWLSIFRLTMTYRFGPISTRQADAGTKRGLFYADCSSGQWLTFDSAFYRRGKVVLDGRAYEIALVDIDFDGKYNNSFSPPKGDGRDPRCDVLAIDLDGDSKFQYGRPGVSEIMPLSRLINVNGRYYSMDVADDGSSIEFRQAKPQFGTLSLEGKEAKLALWSDVARQQLSGSGHNWNLPAGRYALVTMELTETDAAGDRWAFKIAKAGAGPLGDFEIRPGRTTSFQIGPPFQTRSFMENRNRSVLVGFDLKGRAGERYVPGATRNGKEVPEPQFKIIDSYGKVANSGQFEFR